MERTGLSLAGDKGASALMPKSIGPSLGRKGAVLVGVTLPGGLIAIETVIQFCQNFRKPLDPLPDFEISPL